MALVKVAVLESRFEADLVGKALVERGLSFSVREHHDSAYDGLYLPQQGWGSLWAEEQDRGRVVDVLAAVRRAYALRVV
jgi:hypothetical protein